MNARERHLITKALSLVLAITCWVVAYRKLSGHPVALSTHQAWGIPPTATFALAVFEAAAGALMLMRRTAFLGAMMFMAILAGAVVLHVAHHAPEKTLLPVAFMPPTLALALVTRKQGRRGPRAG